MAKLSLYSFHISQLEERLRLIPADVVSVQIGFVISSCLLISTPSNLVSVLHTISSTLLYFFTSVFSYLPKLISIWIETNLINLGPYMFLC